MNIEWGSIADWASAIATTTAALTSLYLAKKSTEKKAKVKVTLDVIIPSGDRVISGNIVNEGNISLFLNSANIYVYQKKFFTHDKFMMKLTPVQFIGEVPDIHMAGKTIEIIPGDSYEVLYKYLPFKKAFDEQLKDLEGIKMKFVFTDTFGNKYSSEDISNFFKEVK